MASDTSALRRVYLAHGVEIEGDLGRIRRDGEEIYLRPKGRLLLMCLIERRQAPVSKEELLRLVWNGAAVSDDTLVNCVQEVRRALGDDAKNPVFIRTMPKTGYWFIAPVNEPGPAAAVDPAPGNPPPESPAALPAPARKRWAWAAVLACAALVLLAGWRPWTPRPPLHWEAARWQFDEGVGSSVHETVSSAATALPDRVSWTAGIDGSALLFRGHDVVLRGRGNGPLSAAPPDRTLVAWVKMPRVESDTVVVFSYGDPEPDYRHDCVTLIVHVSGRAGVSSNRNAVVSRSRVDDDRWHQLAGIVEGASRRARIFVDGVEEAEGTLPDIEVLPDKTPHWSIGRGMRAGTPFRGAIDDVRLFARALHPAEIHALFRCVSGQTDLDAPGGRLFFAPAAGMNVAIDPRRDGESSSRIRNAGLDYAAVAFVPHRPGCALPSTLAGDMGQDLRIEADLRVGGSAAGPVAEAGPYFRSRRSAPGDGILGGSSAGYWVQLKSTGQVLVRRLHPVGTMAFTSIPESFDPDAFHRLAVVVKDDWMEASLDGRALEFDQAGTRSNRVLLPADWETATPRGFNRGSAGIAFGCDSNRGRIGGQEVRNVRLSQ